MKRRQHDLAGHAAFILFQGTVPTLAEQESVIFKVLPLTTIYHYITEASPKILKQSQRSLIYRHRTWIWVSDVQLTYVVQEKFNYPL